MSGTSYSWAEVREKAAEAFGGRYPDAELEAELVAQFRERPAFVVDAIRDVGNGYEQGRITSPWPFLRKRVGESVADVVVSDSSDRDRALAVAERWLRTAGLHFDREAEVVDELFGVRGRLRAWPQLEERMLTLWRELRPLGEAVEVTALVEQSRRFQAPADSDWVGEEPPVRTALA